MSLTLSEVIARLEAEDQSKIVAKGFGAGGSWRGHYSEIAFAPAYNVSVASMLECARKMVGRTLYGWKGGEFPVTLDTECHIANPGVSNGDEDALTQYRMDEMLGVGDAARIATLEARVRELEGTLRDAIESVESWAAYAGDYFRKKHDLAGNLAELRAALNPGGSNAER